MITSYCYILHTYLLTSTHPYLHSPYLLTYFHSYPPTKKPPCCLLAAAVRSLLSAEREMGPEFSMCLCRPLEMPPHHDLLRLLHFSHRPGWTSG